MSSWHDIVQYPQKAEPVFVPPVIGWDVPQSQPVLPTPPANVGSIVWLEFPLIPAGDWDVPQSQPVLPRAPENVGSNVLVEFEVPAGPALPDVGWFQDTNQPVEGFTLIQGGSGAYISVEEVPQGWFQPQSQPVIGPPTDTNNHFFFDPEPIPTPPPGLDTWYVPLSEPVLPRAPENVGSFVSLGDPIIPGLDTWYVPLSEPVLPKPPENVGAFVSLGDPLPNAVPDLDTWYTPLAEPVLPRLRLPEYPGALLVEFGIPGLQVYSRGVAWYTIKSTGVEHFTIKDSSTEHFNIKDSGIEEF